MGLSREPRRRWLLPLAVLAIGLVSVALVSSQFRQAVQEQDRERFEAAVDRLQDSIRDRIEMYVAMLRAGTGLFAAGEVTSPAQFRVFVDRLELQRRYPGVQGIRFTERIPASARADGVPGAKVLDGSTILVADDEVDVADLTHEILTQRGAQAFVARSGAEAWRLLQSGDTRVDLIVSDLGMPHLDGYELIRRVCALPAAMGGTAPAVALTAYAEAEDQRRAMAAGCDLHLAKPITPDDLVAACTTLLKSHPQEAPAG